MIAPKQASNYKMAPIGTHIARCYQFIHIGTNEDEYMGEKKDINKIRLTFELPEEKQVFREGDEPKPTVISQEYTFSMAPKANLRKLVEGIIGTTLADHEADSFDVDSIVGMPCLLNIVHKTSRTGKERAEIATASPLMKSMTAPVAFNPSKIMTYKNFDQEFFDKLPSFLKEKMTSSEEYYDMTHPMSAEEKAKLDSFHKQKPVTDNDISAMDIPF